MPGAIILAQLENGLRRPISTAGVVVNIQLNEIALTDLATLVGLTQFPGDARTRP